MSSTFVMVLDNVLRKPSTEAINIQGLHLYNAFVSIGRLAILCGEDEERAQWFLRTNGLTKHVHLVPEDPMNSMTKFGRRFAQITYLRTQQCFIEFVVEPDPEIATELFRGGIPVLSYLHPKYTQPSFRPDYESAARPWEDLTQEVRYQEEMRARQPLPVEPD